MGGPRGIRIAAPTLVIAGLTWSMVGCVYLPWFERAKLTGTKRDFRNWWGSSPMPELVDGRVTEDQVRRLLGDPLRVSPNGQVWAYALTTVHGIWVEPLCLSVGPGGQHAYALGLRFDGKGTLVHHHLAVADIPPAIGIAHALDEGPPFARDRLPDQAVGQALDLLDADNDVKQVGPHRTDPAPGEVRLPRAFALTFHY